MAAIPFTGNYADLSTNRGYQFKFHCMKCGNGYQSTFEASAMGTAASAAQAQAAREQAVEKARSVDYLAGRDLARQAALNCPKCGARTQGGRFCPECGATVSAKRKCAHCGTEADGAPRFCPECGKPYG